MFVVSRDNNEKTNQFHDGDCCKDAVAGEGAKYIVCGQVGMLDVGSRVHTECNTGVVHGTVYGHCCLSCWRKEVSPELLGWSADREFSGSAWGYEASCSLTVRSSTEVGMPCFRMLPPKWLQKVSDPSCPLVSRIRDVCSLRFPANGFGASVVYVLAGHSGVYIGKTRLDRKRMCGMGPRAPEHLRALLYTNVRDGMKPRYQILRGSLGSVFMLPAVWCDSEVRALATEAVLIKLESPECNVVDRVGSMAGERCKIMGKRKRPSSWFRRSKSPFASIWSHHPVRRGNRDSRVLRCFSSTCTRCRSVKHLPKKVCWVPSTCLSGRELAS